MPGNRSFDEFQKQNARAMMPKGQSEELPGEDADGLTSHKSEVGVVFVDEDGAPHALQYSHLYRCYVENGELVAEFSEHLVRMRGEGLWNPIQNSLLMLLTLHKRKLVVAKGKAGAVATPKALSDRHAGFSGAKPEPEDAGWRVSSITVEPREQK